MLQLQRPTLNTPKMNPAELNADIKRAAALMLLENVERVEQKNTSFNLGETSDDCLLFTGDNLRVLSRLLQSSADRVDFCYIDPPYNTGQEFIYSDSRTKISSGPWGKHHDWLAFMLPRLVSANHLLKSSGIIAISIDDYEYAHLKILMDNIFGQQNYIATLVVCRSKNGKGGKQHVAVNHEYVLLYGKTSDAAVSGLIEDESKVYDKEDEHGEYRVDGLFRKKGDASLREDRPNMYYPLYYSAEGKVSTEKTSETCFESFPVDSNGIARRWLWGRDKAGVDSWMLYASKKGVIYVKNYKHPNKKVKLRSILDSPNYLTDKATTEIKKIYGEKLFETPKPLSLIRDLIDCCAPPDATVLDFFAGTGTTAEAAWELNQRDAMHRRVILVEQNQRIDQKHVASTGGFEFISDLTEFRLSSIQARDAKYKFSVLPA